MGEEEMGIESPIELLRQLIEESGKWTEEIVKLARTQIIVWIFVIIQSAILLSYVLYNMSQEQEPIPLPWLVVLSIVFIFLVLTWGNTLIQLRKKYRNRLARRERWRNKFELLKKQEGEIEGLLSGEAG